MEEIYWRLPKTKVGQKTFDRIIKTGKRLFSLNGYQATSINDIIAKSRVAAGTFYIYFDHKLGLYLYLLDQYKTSIRNASNKAIEGLKTRYDIEKAGLKAFILYVKKDPLAYRIVWESLFVDFEIFKHYYTSFATSYLHHLQTYVDKNEVRSDIDLETVSYILMGISNFVGLQVLFKPESTDFDVDFIVDEAMKMIDAGLFIHS